MRRCTGSRSRETTLLERIWYGGHPLRWLLWPLSWLFCQLSSGRRLAYRHAWLKSYRAPVPLIVVGNISVGGTGKTPFTLALCHALQQRGWRPGIVSRGYGGSSRHYPLAVTADSDPRQTGDEPLLLAQRSGCPMRVDPLRSRAVRSLLAQEEVDIIISDDGLQHYALQRNLEMVIVDGQRRYGNGMCLPAGPLRESTARLQQVDAVFINGPVADEPGFDLAAEAICNLQDGHGIACAALPQPVHAVAGIGRPQRFFDSLRGLGLDVIEHPFPDHHAFTAQDLDFGDQQPVLMTEKDAVKCRVFAAPHYWYLPVTARLNGPARLRLEQLLDSLGQAPARVAQEQEHG